MYKLLYPSIRVRTAPPVSVIGSGLGLVLVLVCAYCSACADLCDCGPESLEILQLSPGSQLPRHNLLKTSGRWRLKRDFLWSGSLSLQQRHSTVHWVNILINLKKISAILFPTTQCYIHVSTSSVSSEQFRLTEVHVILKCTRGAVRLTAAARRCQFYNEPDGLHQRIITWDTFLVSSRVTSENSSSLYRPRERLDAWDKTT